MPLLSVTSADGVPLRLVELVADPELKSMRISAFEVGEEDLLAPPDGCPLESW